VLTQKKNPPCVSQRIDDVITANKNMTDDSSRGIQASDPVSLSCAGSDTDGMCFANNARNIPLLNVDFTASNASPCALLLPYGGSDIVTEDPDALHTRPRVSVPSHGRSVSLHLPHEFLCSSPPSSPQKSARLHVFDSFVAPLPQTPTRSQSPVIGGSLGQLHRRSPSTASTR
jgi:hypothetical protein